MSSTAGARTRLDALDGVRALSALSVFMFHTQQSLRLPGGGAGVEVFFVLSGFLITSLLYKEWAQTGRVDLLHFYWRRFIRLVPAMLFFFAVLFTWLSVFGNRPFIGRNPLLYDQTPLTVMEMASRHFMTLTNYWLKGPEPFTPITHLWSLSVEQQFYLVWPLAFIVLLRFDRIWLNAAVLLVAGLAAMSIGSLWMPAERVQLLRGVFEPAYALAFGCLAGLIAARFGDVRIPAAALVMVLAALVTRVFYPLPNVFLDRIVVVTSSMLLVLGCAEGRTLPAKVLAWAPLAALGRRSYGFYVWHLPFLWWFVPLGGWQQVAAGLAATLIATEISYRLIEQPALRWGRWTPTDAEQPAEATAVPVGATA